MQSIPKRIIQTGKSRTLPLRDKAAVSSVMLHNPDFEHLYFDDGEVEAFITLHFPEYRTVFDSFPHRIQRYDFFRYLAVYKLGGFYFDLDVFFAKPLSDLTTEKCVFPFEELTLNQFLRSQHQIDWELGNYGFGASAGHPFLRAVIENCVRAQSDSSWAAPMMAGIPFLFRTDFDVLNTTGPGLVTRTFAEDSEAASSVKILFPDNVTDERTWHSFGDYGVHLMAASWRHRGSVLRRRLARLWETKTRRRLLAESRAIGTTRKHPKAIAKSA